ncbi:MAG TPA: AsmA family protein [Xanthobacteraceae bacterium]|nr:AsmA family protein [Xanthobacteraceae bacterium]
MKMFKIAGTLTATIVLLVGIVLTAGLPASLLSSTLKERIARDTGYEIDVTGAARMAVWPSLALTLNGVTLSKSAKDGAGERFEIASMRIEMPFGSITSGNPVITHLTLEKPVAYLPLLRERTPAKPSASSAGSSSGSTDPELRIARITVSDGAVVFSNPRDKIEDRIDAIAATVTLDADRRAAVSLSARAGPHALKLELQASMPAAAQRRGNIPVEMTFAAPSLLSDTLTAKADVRLAGTMLRINGISGALGGKPFTGWASVDLASKPLVKLDLDAQDLAIGKPSAAGAPNSASPAPWSDTPFDLSGLNYVDAELRLSAARLAIGDLQIAPLALGATLNRGILTAQFENLGLYEGLARGDLTIDAAGTTPRYVVQADLAGVRARPLLTSLADFDHLGGKLQAKIAVRSAGNSPRAVMTALDGTASLDFRDGRIRGLNVAQMIRSLTAGTLKGWQADEVQATDLSQLSASFRIAEGKAETTDVVLLGPLVRMRGGGTVDLAGKALALRVEPKLVMSLEGQGGAGNPVGLGIPVVIEGPWTSPQIYPDVAGILDHPDAAYARLRELGQGLFGADPKRPGQSLGETLDGLIQQGLGGTRQPPRSTPDQEDAPGGASAINGLLKQLFGR